MNLQPAQFTCQRIPGPTDLYVLHGRTDRAMGSWQIKPIGKTKALCITLVIKEQGIASAIRHLQAQRFLLMQWLSELIIECPLQAEKGGRLWITGQQLLKLS